MALCISLWQPWASLLVAGAKRCETRGWPIRHRGPLLIHAAKLWNGELYDLSRGEPFVSALRELGCSFPVPTGRGTIREPRGMPFGAIVGRVEVVECYPTEKVRVDDDCPFVHDPGRWCAISSTERAFGDYSADRYAWLCANPVAFKTPIPFRGAQGLFEVPDDLVKEAA